MMSSRASARVSAILPAFRDLYDQFASRTSEKGQHHENFRSGEREKRGRVTIDFEVANNDDLVLARSGKLPAGQVRRQTVKGIVDSGATKLILPAALTKQLGLRIGDTVQVRYADGRTSKRREAEGAHVTLLGRHDTFSAIVEPRRKDALIGAVVLEVLDLLVDCSNQCVVPRDAKGPIYEIE